MGKFSKSCRGVSTAQEKMWLAALVATGVAVGFGWFVKTKFGPKKPPKLHRPDWKKDVVYLVQFPLTKDVRSVSPFCLKLEAWFILNGIPYENVFSTRFSQK